LVWNRQLFGRKPIAIYGRGARRPAVRNYRGDRGSLKDDGNAAIQRGNSEWKDAEWGVSLREAGGETERKAGRNGRLSQAWKGVSRPRMPLQREKKKNGTNQSN